MTVGAATGLTTGASAVTVAWADGSAPSDFHHLWLRDNCACAECRHPDTWERTLDTYSLPLDIAPFALHAATSKIDVMSDVRIGITKAAELPWRYGLKGSRFVSKRFPERTSASSPRRRGPSIPGR